MLDGGRSDLRDRLLLTSLLLENLEAGKRPAVPPDCPLAAIIAECWDTVRVFPRWLAGVVA